MERCLWFGILNATLGQFFQGLFFKLCTLSASQGSGGEAVAEKKRERKEEWGKELRLKPGNLGAPVMSIFILL